MPGPAQTTTSWVVVVVVSLRIVASGTEDGGGTTCTCSPHLLTTTVVLKRLAPAVRGHHAMERDGQGPGSLRHFELARRMVLGRYTVAYPGSGDLNGAVVVVRGRSFPGDRWRERELRHDRADRESGGGALVNGVGGYDRDPSARSRRGLSGRQVDEHLDGGGVAPEVRLAVD